MGWQACLVTIGETITFATFVTDAIISSSLSQSDGTYSSDWVCEQSLQPKGQELSGLCCKPALMANWVDEHTNLL